VSPEEAGRGPRSGFIAFPSAAPAGWAVPGSSELPGGPLCSGGAAGGSQRARGDAAVSPLFQMTS